MKLNYIYPDILEIQGFLSDEECESFLDIIDGYSEDDWWGQTNQRTFTYENDQWLGKNLHLQGDDRTQLHEIQKRVESIFLNYSKIQDIGIVHRIVEGSGGIHLHNDNGQPADKDNTFGVVLYLNDDYVGGEVEYPDRGFAYKPVRGSLLVHNASLMHKVNDVISGKRYMLTTFVAGSEGSPAEIGEINDL